MMGRLNMALGICLVFCALFLVNAQYQSRRLFIELERTQAATRQLEIEWRQLQLEQSTLAKQARIEAMAKRELNMAMATPARTLFLTPGVK